MRTKILAAAAAAVLATGLAACGGEDAPVGEPAEEAEEYPTEDMDWTIAFGPGGGNDIMARTLADILEKNDMYPHELVLTNREGGSGATGWGYLYNQRGSGYGISTTSGSFITTPLQADTGWEPTDFTPVGLMAADDLLFIVDGGSEFQTWEDWVAHATEKGTVVVGGIGTVNVDFIVHAILAEEAGYEIDYVTFNEQGQLLTALLSGALEAAVSNPAEILGQIEAGEVRALLFTGEESMEALPDVPTAASLDYPEMPSLPRGMILPPDAPQEAQDWWIETMQQVVEMPEWQEYLDTNHLSEDLRWGEDFTTFLEETSEEFRRILEERGAL